LGRVVEDELNKTDKTDIPHSFMIKDAPTQVVTAKNANSHPLHHFNSNIDNDNSINEVITKMNTIKRHSDIDNGFDGDSDL
jgi:hypothetical protein